jgi:modulator of drug activity B
MSNVLIINGHQYYPFSEGKLNATLVDKALTLLQAKGHDTRVVTMAEQIDVEQELANHQWADVVILQSPVNWMGVTWSFKKYMDEVYTAGMGGALCLGDGRNAEEPKENYGTGGTLNNTKYMMSLTFNAPKEAFDNIDEFFNGKTVDELLFPMHMNFKFFGMKGLPTFACFDVMKNADVENDLQRFEQHINKHF